MLNVENESDYVKHISFGFITDITNIDYLSSLYEKTELFLKRTKMLGANYCNQIDDCTFLYRVFHTAVYEFCFLHSENIY